MQVQLTPDFVNQPQKNPKFGSIKCGATYYSVPKDMLPAFQKGVPTTVDVEQNDKGYWNVIRVYNGAPAPQSAPVASQQYHAPVQAPPAPAHAPAAPVAHPNGERYEARKQEDIFVCGVVNQAIAHQSYPLDEIQLMKLVNMARQAWRGGGGF